MEKTIPNITFHQGLPSPEVIDEFAADRRHRLIVLDDLMHHVVQMVDMELLFTLTIEIGKPISGLLVGGYAVVAGSESLPCSTRCVLRTCRKVVMGALTRLLVMPLELIVGAERVVSPVVSWHV